MNPDDAAAAEELDLPETPVRRPGRLALFVEIVRRPRLALARNRSDVDWEALADESEHPLVLDQIRRALDQAKATA